MTLLKRSLLTFNLSNALKLIIIFSTLFKTLISKKKDINYHLLTYSTKNHDSYAQKLIGTAHIGGFNFTKHMRPTDLDDFFVKRNEHILNDFKNGPGGWIWKPYLILKYMIYHASVFDVICFCDSRYMFNDTIINRVNKLLEPFPHIAIPMNKPDEAKYKEKQFSKGDAFAIMGVDGNDIRESHQAWAGFNCYRVSFVTMQFVAEWMTYTQDGRIIVGNESKFTKNDPIFYDNRQDQTVLSLLAKKWKIKFFSIENSFGLLNCRRYQCDYDN